MRAHKSEAELKTIADGISRKIVIRFYERGNSKDEEREPSTSEREYIYKVAYGALLGLNLDQITRSSAVAADAIINASEYILNQFLLDCNGYDTIYCPLKKVVREWENEK